MALFDDDTIFNVTTKIRQGFGNLQKAVESYLPKYAPRPQEPQKFVGGLAEQAIIEAKKAAQRMLAPRPLPTPQPTQKQQLNYSTRTLPTYDDLGRKFDPTQPQYGLQDKTTQVGVKRSNEIMNQSSPLNVPNIFNGPTRYSVPIPDFKIVGGKVLETYNTIQQQVKDFAQSRGDKYSGFSLANLGESALNIGKDVLYGTPEDNALIAQKRDILQGKFGDKAKYLTDSVLSDDKYLKKQGIDLSKLTPQERNIFDRASKVQEERLFGAVVGATGPIKNVAKEGFKQVGKRVLEAGGGKYNLADLNVSDDIFNAIKTTAKNQTVKINEARRGTLTNEGVRLLADALDTTPDQLIKAKPGTAYNAEELVRAGDIVKTLRNKASGLSRVYEAARKQGTANPKLQLQALNALNEAAQAELSLLGRRTEAGRALQANKIIKQALKDPDQFKIEKIVKQFGGEENVAKFIERYNELSVKEGPESAFRFLRSLHNSTTSDKILEYWYNSILSSPTTHLVNTISNAATSLLSPVEKAFVAAADIPVSKLQGRARERFFGEAGADLLGARQGFVEGLRKALQIIRKGYTMEDVAKLELRRPQAIGGKVGTAINLPSRALVAEDAFFKSINYSADLYSKAYRLASQAGLKGEALSKKVAELIANPTDELMQGAKKMADYRVFQKEPGKFTAAILNAREKLPFKLGSFISPFIQTPSNLLKYGLERTPAGAVTAIGKTGAEVSDQLGKSFMGSSIAAALAFLAAEGKISGAGPKNQKDRDLLYKEGWQPYSIKIGDKWVSYQRLEPFNQIFHQVASFYENFVVNGEKPTTDKIQGFAQDIGRNLISQTYMSGVADLLNAIEDPARYGENFIERTAQGIVPYSSALRTITRGIDPTVRETEGLGEAIKAEIPGLSSTLPAKENTYGEPIVREGGFLRQLFPIKFTTEKSDAVGIRENTSTAQSIRDIDNALKDGKTPKGGKDLVTARQAEYIYSQILNKTATIEELQTKGLINDEVIDKVLAIRKLDKAGFAKADRELIYYSGTYRAQRIMDRLDDFTKNSSKKEYLNRLIKNGLIDASIADYILKQVEDK